MPLQVYFEIPALVALGLASGRLERIGGIIREKGSKQIVAWLRESGQLEFGDPDVAAGLLKAMQIGSGNLGSIATSVLDAAINARNNKLLMRQINHISRLSQISALTGILNVGLGAISFLTMIQNSNELADLIVAQAERSRQVERESVLEYLELLKLMTDERRRLASEIAVLPLIKARNNLLASFEDSLNSTTLKSRQTVRAIQYLVMTMQLDVLHVRSYLDTGEVNVARSRLKDCLADYEERTRAFVKKLLGKYPAKYFHSNVGQEDFGRYLQIEMWLRDRDDIVLELVEEQRQHFWKGAASRGLKSKPLENLRSAKSIDHLTALTLAELLIENVQRLRGYELEVATLRMSMDEWDKLADLEEHDFAVVVDLEVLDDLKRTA